MYYVSLRINTVYIGVTDIIFEFRKHKVINYLILKDTKIDESFQLRISLFNFYKELYPYKR